MGLTAEWVAVHSAAEEAAATNAFATVGLRPRGTHAGWHWATTERFDSELDPIVARVARICGHATLGGWVADSDCAYLSFSSSNGDIRTRIAINAVAPFEEDGEWMHLWSDLDSRRAAFSDLGKWSASYAPRALNVKQLMQEMPGVPGATVPAEAPRYGDTGPWDDENPAAATEWAFAEDAVRLIYSRLGLGGPFEFVCD